MLVMEDAIHTEGLTFAYRGQPVLKGVDLRVPEGAVYGYLGRNGAGKSTTLRLLLGLLPVRRGSVSFFGRPFAAARTEALSQVGSLIEGPAYYGHLTGRENLLCLDRIYGCGTARVDRVLETVGLKGAGDRRVKRYSTGMKQRLGLAMALYHDPRVLVLDEPLNGLDPEGVHEVRALICRLREEGRTVLLSSHMLAEAEKVCTHVGVLAGGRLVFQGSVDGLSAVRKKEVRFRVSDAGKGCGICRENGIAARMGDGDGVFCAEAGDDETMGRIVGRLVSAGVDVYGVEPLSDGLESAFLELMTENHENA